MGRIRRLSEIDRLFLRVDSLLRRLTCLVADRLSTFFRSSATLVCAAHTAAAPVTCDGSIPGVLHAVIGELPATIRIACCGGLTPQSAAADLLEAAIAVAERQGAQTVDVVWIGEGDLRGVLAAQPLPGNLRQSFIDPRLFDAPDLSAVPIDTFDAVIALDRPSASWPAIEAAFRHGIPVLADIDFHAVRRQVSDRQDGWSFDGRRAENLLDVLRDAAAMRRGVGAARPAGRRKTENRGVAAAGQIALSAEAAGRPAVVVAA